MKIAATLMVAGLLLAAAPAVVVAGEDAPVVVAPQSQDLLSQILGGEAPITPCDPAALVDGQEPALAATQFCGSCSEAVCRGSIRGGRCRVARGPGDTATSSAEASCAPPEAGIASAKLAGFRKDSSS